VEGDTDRATMLEFENCQDCWIISRKKKISIYKKESRIVKKEKEKEKEKKEKESSPLTNIFIS